MPRLQPRSRIAVVGGGPAGSFFALNALRIAETLGIPLEITLFEAKDLALPGPRGCNMCAGVLSHRTLSGLAALDIPLPPDVIMGRVRAYQLHWGEYSVRIHPPDTRGPVVTVYRGGGPRASPFPPVAGFDAFLLGVAEARGARVARERVEEVSFDPLPRVRTTVRDETFDLVVLATGVNGRLPRLNGIDYARPDTEAMAQDSLLLHTEAGRSQMDGTIHIFIDRPRQLIFGALIPKGPFTTISLLGRRMARDVVKRFLTEPRVMQIVGETPPQICGCRPRAAVSLARGYYRDRFVAVGDACVTRLYKDGIGSAFATAHAAAETALRHGIGREAFAAHYAPVCRAVALDNRCGRLVFAFIKHSKHNRLFRNAVARALDDESTDQQRRPLSGVLWCLFTGDERYGTILRKMFAPGVIAHIAKCVFHQLFAVGASRTRKDRS